MILNKYTIFDSALEAYHQDYSLENDAIALRQFADMANEETQIAKNPQDYSLWYIGTFETTTGELTPIQPVCLAKAHEHVLHYDSKKKATYRHIPYKSEEDKKMIKEHVKKQNSSS